MVSLDVEQVVPLYNRLDGDVGPVDYCKNSVVKRRNLLKDGTIRSEVAVVIWPVCCGKRRLMKEEEVLRAESIGTKEVLYCLVSSHGVSLHMFKPTYRSLEQQRLICVL